MQTRVVELGAYRARAQTWGSGGPAAVILPGMAATARDLAPQIRLLRSLGYTVHVIDLPGFALPPALSVHDARIPRLADYVVETVRALGVERALFLGHSLGGGLSLYVAIGRPDLVERLVLIAPAALGRSLVWTYKLFCMPLVGRALLRPYRRGNARHTRHFLIGSARRNDERFISTLLRLDRHTPLKVRTMRAIVWANQPSPLKRILLLLVPGGEQGAFTLKARLDGLRRVPTLLLWGSEDRVMCVRDAAALRLAHPEAEIHIARGLGHLPPLEAPAWVNGHIARFLAREREALPRAS